MLRDPFNELGSETCANNFIKGIADKCFHSGLKHSRFSWICEVTLVYFLKNLFATELDLGMFQVQSR